MNQNKHYHKFYILIMTGIIILSCCVRSSRYTDEIHKVSEASKSMEMSQPVTYCIRRI